MAQNIFMPKNVNCINIIITLEGVEKIQETEKKKWQQTSRINHAGMWANWPAKCATMLGKVMIINSERWKNSIVVSLNGTLLLFIRNPRNKTNLVQDNEQYHTKVLHRSSHLNGGTQGFSPQISDLILRATLYHVINSTSWNCCSFR